MLVAQGDLPAALAAFQAGMAICQSLAARDPDNVQWQLDLVVSLSKLVAPELASREQARQRLRDGLARLEALHAAQRLPPSQDWRHWFKERLQKLDGTGG